jgi:lipoprotein-anchoring transpeptidase ErfK/SrfK
MRAKCLLLILLMLTSAGCSLDPVASLGGATPTLLPGPTESAALTLTATLRPTASPTALPTATRTPPPSPIPTRGPEAWYKRLIVVDQDAQMMYVYENGARIRSIPCSTGKPGEETHTPAWEGDVGHYVGTFFSFGVYADEGWYLFDHYGGMLIHGAPYLIEDDVKVYQELDVLGVRPASHGCIRLPPEEAAWLTSWEPQGAHVIITPPRQDP